MLKVVNSKSSLCLWLYNYNNMKTKVSRILYVFMLALLNYAHFCDCILTPSSQFPNAFSTSKFYFPRPPPPIPIPGHFVPTFTTEAVPTTTTINPTTAETLTPSTEGTATVAVMSTTATSLPTKRETSATTTLPMTSHHSTTTTTNVNKSSWDADVSTETGSETNLSYESYDDELGEVPPLASLAVRDLHKNVITIGGGCDPKEAQCEEHALCNQQSDGFFKCACKPNYEMNLSKVCVRAKGTKCANVKNECDSDRTMMTCINHECTCDESDSYNSTILQCTGRVGGSCFPGKECVANAKCVTKPSQKTNQGRCQCQPGFVESQHGLCLRSYGKSCSQTEQCDTLNLVCKEGICNCPDSLQVWDERSQSCVALVGAQCSDERGGTMCTQWAYCKRINLKLPGRCACQPNSAEVEPRRCSPVTGWKPVESKSSS